MACPAHRRLRIRTRVYRVTSGSSHYQSSRKYLMSGNRTMLQADKGTPGSGGKVNSIAECGGRGFVNKYR